MYQHLITSAAVRSPRRALAIALSCLVSACALSAVATQSAQAIRPYQTPVLGNLGGVAVDACTENVYVTEDPIPNVPYNYGVYEYSDTGGFVNSFGGPSSHVPDTNPRPLTDPAGVAVVSSSSVPSEDGDVFVANTALSAVDEFDANGNLITAGFGVWTDLAQDPNLNNLNQGFTGFLDPTGVAVSQDPNNETVVYVTDRRYGVTEFDAATGDLLNQTNWHDDEHIFAPHAGSGVTTYGVAVDPTTGNVYVTSGTGSETNGVGSGIVYEFGPNGAINSGVPLAWSSAAYDWMTNWPGWFGTPEGVTADWSTADNIYGVDATPYDSPNVWSVPGSVFSPSQPGWSMLAPTGVAVDPVSGEFYFSTDEPSLNSEPGLVTQWLSSWSPAKTTSYKQLGATVQAYYCGTNVSHQEGYQPPNT